MTEEELQELRRLLMLYVETYCHYCQGSSVEYTQTVNCHECGYTLGKIQVIISPDGIRRTVTNYIHGSNEE